MPWLVAHSWRDIEQKVASLRSSSIDEIAGIILDLEAQLEECSGKLSEANDKLEDMKYEIEEAVSRAEDMRGD